MLCLRWVAGVFVTLSIATGCDTRLDPFQESDLHFSVFGYLDAAADTQYLRITPLRDSIALSPGPLDAVARLENLSSGRQILLHDSLFRFEDRIAYNFWSAQPVEHGATYRLTVTRSDGAASTATVTLPPPFPEPTLAFPQQPNLPPSALTVSIEMPGIERLAALILIVTYRFPGEAEANAQTLTLSYLDRVAELSDGLGLQFAPYNDFFSRARSCPLVDDVQVVIAAAGPEWPDFLALDDETLALADIVTNVDHGVGILGGVSKHVLPWPAVRAFLNGNQQTCAQCVTSDFPQFCFR